MTGDHTPIVVERTMKAPPERVWRAITTPSEMRQFFFEDDRCGRSAASEDFRPEVGFETKFVVNNGEKDYLHHWRITDVVPNQKIAYDWLYPAYPGASVVTWELVPVPEGTRLTLTHRGGWSFPQSEIAFRRETCHAGWEYFINKLADFVASP